MIESFYNLRTDLDKLKYAIHIDKIIQDVTDENQNSYKILQLLLNTLYVISETDKNLDLVLSVFKLRLACILGFTPNIQKCVNCTQTENLNYFSIRDNGLKCEACAQQDKSCIQISQSTFLALKYIITSPAKRLYSFNLKDEALRRTKYNFQIIF